MRIFFAGPLTDLKNPPLTKAFYKKLGDSAKAKGFDYFWAYQRGTDPEENPDVPPSRIYQVDTYELEESDIMIAYVGEPSTGTGIEIEYARQHNIPVYYMYEKGKIISRMILGSPAVRGIIIFTDEEDALRQLDNLLAQVHQYAVPPRLIPENSVLVGSASAKPPIMSQ